MQKKKEKEKYLNKFLKTLYIMRVQTYLKKKKRKKI